MKVSESDAMRLSLTTLPTLGASWLAPKLGAFRSVEPSIRVELDLSPHAQDLTCGAFDAAIRHGLGRWNGMRAHQALSKRVHAAVRTVASP
jgi:LysR family glycine cleavage system transcriptional activator